MKSGYRSLWGLGALMLLLAGCGGNTTVGGASLDLLSLTPSPLVVEFRQVTEGNGQNGSTSRPVLYTVDRFNANARVQGAIRPGVVFHTVTFEYFTPTGAPIAGLTTTATPTLMSGSEGGDGSEGGTSNCVENSAELQGGAAYFPPSNTGQNPEPENVLSFQVPTCSTVRNFFWNYWVPNGRSEGEVGWTVRATFYANDDTGHEYSFSRVLPIDLVVDEKALEDYLSAIGYVGGVDGSPNNGSNGGGSVYWVSPLPGAPNTGPVDLTIYTDPDASEVEFFYDYGGTSEVGNSTMVPLGLAEPGALVLNGRYRAWTMTWDSRVSGQNEANIVAMIDGAKVSSSISLRNNPEFNLAFPGVPGVEYCRGDLESFIFGLPFIGMPIQNLLGNDDIGMIFRTRVPRGLFRPIEVYVGGPGNWTSDNPNSPIDYGASGVYVGRAQRIDDPHAGHTYPEPYEPYEPYEGEEYYYFGWNSYLLPPASGTETYEFFLQVVDNAGIAQSVVVTIGVKNSFLGVICITLEDITTALSDLVNSGIEIIQPIIDIIGDFLNLGEPEEPEEPPLPVTPPPVTP